MTTPRCALCRLVPSDTNPLATLMEVDALAGPPPGDLLLCHACLDANAVDSWDAREALGRSLERLLPLHPGPLHPAFTYLADAERVYLVHLSTSWVQRERVP